MAKKQKRQVRSTAVKPAAPAAPAASAVGVEARPARRAPVTSTFEFNPDYTPVIKDLKRIGILAGSFLAVLVVLSFILN